MRVRVWAEVQVLTARGGCAIGAGLGLRRWMGLGIGCRVGAKSGVMSKVQD